MKPKLLARNLLGTLIAKIINNDLTFLLPGKIFENEKIVAFHHPQPNYKYHILIVPKKSITDIGNLSQEDLEYTNEILARLPKILLKSDLIGKSYSLITNSGEKQHIKQLHFHLVAD